MPILQAGFLISKPLLHMPLSSTGCLGQGCEAEATTKSEAKQTGAIESITQEKKNNSKKNNKPNLLPNNSESWKYYQERNGKNIINILMNLFLL